MIGTEFIDGQGLGNQLFCYVTARAVALENGYEFGTAGQERFAVNIHSDRGMYFMDMDLGHAISEDEKKNFRIYHDAEERLFIGNSAHDLTHGCYVAGADPAIHRVEDNTLLYGNMQDESYFVKYLPQVKEWLKVKKEYDSYEYSRENLCIINMRGGEYTGSPELLINRKYWLHGMEEMKKIDEVHKAYEICKEVFSPTVGIIAAGSEIEDKEEYEFYKMAHEFFFQKRQKELIAKGIY